MKTLSLVLMLVLSTASFASSVTETFLYNGTQDSTQMSLNAEKTHTEYRYEQRPAICYRQEIRYRTECTNNGNRPVCYSVPVSVSVPFPCTQTVTVPYEVKDYDVEARVDLRVLNASVLNAAETFKVTLDGDHISLSAVGSKKYFILLKDQKYTESMSGSVKFITASYVAELVEAAPIVNALEMTNIVLKDSLLNFNIGPVNAPEYMGYELTVKKAPLLGSDIVLFDRELGPSEMMISAQGNISMVSVDLQKLGVDIVSGRYTLVARVFFKHKGVFLNGNQFSVTQASRTLIYKL